MAFVMVLSYSRHLFLRFYLNASMPSFLHGHVAGLRTSMPCQEPCSTIICAAPCSSASPMRSASIRRCSSSPPGIASNRGPWRWPGAMRRAGSSGRSASYASASLPPGALPILPTSTPRRCSGVKARRPSGRVRRIGSQCARVLRGGAAAAAAVAQRALPLRGTRHRAGSEDPLRALRLNDYSIPHTHVRRTLEVLATSRRCASSRDPPYRRASAQLRSTATDRGGLPYPGPWRSQARRPRTPGDRPAAPRRPECREVLRRSPPSAACTWPRSPAASSNCCKPTAPPPSRAPWSRRCARTLRTWPPCATSSISSAPGAANRRRSR
jgi:hypothetical protein